MKKHFTSRLNPTLGIRLRHLALAALLATLHLGVAAGPEEWYTSAHPGHLSAWNLMASSTPDVSPDAAGMVALSCKPYVNVSLGVGGFAVLTSLTLVNAPQYPPHMYIIDIMGPLGNTVYCEQIGQELMVLVTEIPTNNSCMSTVFVEDKLRPVFNCQPDTAYCTVDIFSLDFEDYLEPPYDNCDTDLDLWYSYVIQNLPCNPHNLTQQITVTWTATDQSGNSATCTDILYLKKPAIGQIVFPPNTSVPCEDPDIDPSVTGEPTFQGVPIGHTCQYVVGYVDQQVPMCNGAYKVLRTWKVIDWCTGVTVTRVQEILIVDNTPPDLTCPANITIGTDPGVCTTKYTLPLPIVSDACADPNQIGIQITVSGIPGFFTPGQMVNLPLGTTLITIRATDPCGNTRMCQYSVTVRDNTPPIPVCHDLVVSLGADGMATLFANGLPFPIQESCGILSTEIWRMTDVCGVPADLVPGPDVKFCCDDIGTTVTVSFKVTDLSGNMNTCMFQVTVTDELPPVAECKDLTVMLGPDGEVVITADQINDGSTDNCSIIDLEVTPSEFDCDDVGVNVVILTVTDQGGNTATCSANVTVVDDVPPIAECQDISVNIGPGGLVTITAEQIDNGSSDNCGIDTLFLNQTTFDCDDEGENLVTLTVTDFYGNESTCTATVTVTTSPPDAVCQDITVALDANGQVTITGADVDGGSTDDCGIDSLSVTPASFDCTDLGPNEVTLTVTDISGNTATCTAIVTVIDSLPPTAQCQDITVMLDAMGMATITAAQIDDNSTDNCTIVSITVTPTDFDCEDVGDNIVTLTVTDQSGNSSTCTANVMVMMPDPPNAECQDITVTLDPNGIVVIDPTQINNGSSTQCGNLTFEVTPDTLTCEDLGPNVVVLTVTDEAGMSATCTATVTVQENLPVANCQNITISLDENGEATITPLQINDNSTDDCGIVMYAVTPDSFDCVDVGDNVVTLTVTDASGNTATCTAIVTVQDTLPPTAICQDITVTLDANGNASITAAQIDNGSFDNCAVDLITVTPASFDCEDIGPVVVTLTVSDEAGNVSTCTATVTVELDPPVAICQDITVSLGPGGIVVIDPLDIDNGSSSPCGNLEYSVDPDTFDCEDIGVQIVTLTVEDIAGNTATCTANVTVVDEESPVCSAQDITVYLDNNGLATITADEVDAGSSDNCGPIDLEVTPTSFDCDDLGPNTVTLTVTDAGGNSSTCTATVTVLDTLPPTALCQDITVSIGVGGIVVITGADIDNNSTDNCFVDDLSVTPDTFDCNDIGPNVVILTVTDQSGNSSSCSAIVTVEADPPSAVCQDITVSLGPDGLVTILPEDVDGGSGGDCGGVELELDEDTFDCTEVGENIVTLTVTDGGGNTTTCTATVTVVDDLDPICLTQDITVYVDGTGNVSITAGQVDDGSTDNCDEVELEVTPAAFDCEDLGDNVVTLTVTDLSGNTSTCTATVTVLDTIAPICLAMDITVSLNGAGMVTITAGQVDDGSSDNCGPPLLDVFPNMFDCDDIGENVVVLTVTDGSGNSSTCTAIVTVEDTEGLQAVCQNALIVLDANGNATVDPEDINAGSGGGCSPGELEFELSQTNFDCSDVGQNIVTLTVTDEQGNTASCTAIVTVVDNMPPVITCPDDVTVDCHLVTNPEDTGQFGNATADDNCPGTIITETHVIDLNNCEVGTITRTFTATDASGNTATCVQVVTINNPDPFDESDITWPASPVNVNICNSTDPEDIPNGEPVFNPNALLCSDISVSFSDDVDVIIDNDPNTPCQVITRTWTVVNNCEPVTQFQFVQTINVVDNVGPVFTNINDMTKTANSNCVASFTLIASATDCAGVSITNDSPYGLTTGANASGNYPVGVTVVIFTATDGCGNTSTMDVVITVLDPDPTEFECEKVIFFLPPETEITINARDFVTFFEGSCSSAEDFIVSYSSTDPYDTLNTYDCGDVGVTTFPLYFWTVGGPMLIDTCPFADLDLRDPTDFCQDGLVVSGDIGNETGLPLEGVEVSVANAPMHPDMTDVNGGYWIDGFLEGQGYEIMPKRDINHKEGVSTLDLVMIQKHLLGKAKLSSPYKMIAADANRSGHITALDLLEIRKLILGISDRFPNNTSWRFVHSDFVFPDPFNPFATVFPESVWLDSVVGLVDTVNFIAMKVGDVNGSFFTRRAMGAELEIRSVNDYTMYLRPTRAHGEMHELVAAGSQPAVEGLQFSLQVGELTEQQQQAIRSEVLSRDQWSYEASSGLLRVSFAPQSPIVLEGLILLQWPGASISGTDILTADLAPEVYVDAAGGIDPLRIRLELQAGEPTLDAPDYELLQNIPNPFTDGTVIRFVLPQAEDVRLSVFDQTGRQVYTTTHSGIQGQNEVALTGRQMGAPGIYYYTLYTAQASFTRKMSYTTH